MRSTGAGNGAIQVAHLFKSASHDPSDSDEESDDSALEDVKPLSERTEISFPNVIEAERCLVTDGFAAVPELPPLEPEIETGYISKKKSKKSKKRGTSWAAEIQEFETPRIV
jgi:hypothetical protein